LRKVNFTVPSVKLGAPLKAEYLLMICFGAFYMSG